MNISRSNWKLIFSLLFGLLFGAILLVASYHSLSPLTSIKRPSTASQNSQQNKFVRCEIPLIMPRTAAVKKDAKEEEFRFEQAECLDIKIASRLTQAPPSMEIQFNGFPNTLNLLLELGNDKLLGQRLYFSCASSKRKVLQFEKNSKAIQLLILQRADCQRFGCNN